METNLDYRAKRAVEARFYKRYGKALELSTAIVAILLVISGILLFLVGQPISWVALTMGIWLLAVTIWIKNYLRNLPASKNPRSINDLLSGEVLGLLPVDINPRLTVTALAKIIGGEVLCSSFWYIH